MRNETSNALPRGDLKLSAHIVENMPGYRRCPASSRNTSAVFPTVFGPSSALQLFRESAPPNRQSDVVFGQGGLERVRTCQLIQLRELQALLKWIAIIVAV